MKNALKLCLALAMTGAMAAQASAAETTFTTSGNAWGGLKQTTAAASTTATGYKYGDTVTTMDMQSAALVGINATTKTGDWTASAQLDILYENTDAEGWKADGYSFSVSNDDVTVSIEDGDLDNVDQGATYENWIDDAREIGDNLDKGHTKLKVALPKAGVTVMYAQNRKTDDDAKDTWSQTDMGLRYDGAGAGLTYAAMYETYSRSVEKDAGDVEKNIRDGATGSDMGFGVGYKMDNMGFNFAYGITAETPGDVGEGATKVEGKETKTTGFAASFDYTISEGSGITVIYGSYEKTFDGEKDAALTDTYVGYVMPLAGAILHVAYFSHTEDKEVYKIDGTEYNTDKDDALTTGGLGARLKYEF